MKIDKVTVPVQVLVSYGEIDYAHNYQYVYRTYGTYFKSNSLSEQYGTVPYRYRTVQHILFFGFDFFDSI